MLRVLGSPKKLCDGVTRRDMLWAGGLGALGLGLPDVLRATAPATTPSRRFGQAKNCILLFLYGSPSQLEWADMKYDAPAEIRGELGGIRSNLPGCDVCELFPNMSRVMEKLTVVRSMTHPHPIHGVAFATTGVPTIDVAMELAPRDGRHWPFIGSVVDYLSRPNQRRRDMPVQMALPWPFSSKREGEVPRAGPYAAFLGGGFNPVWTEFRGQANRTITKTLAGRELVVQEPYVGITSDSTFEIATRTDPSPDMTLDRLDRRRSLIEQFDDARRLDSEATRSFDRYRAMAYDLVSSTRVQEALDVRRESSPVRQRYGSTLFGQACLAARRLVEAGTKFATVFWDEFGLAGSGWDTHWQHYPRMREELCPGLDRALFGLFTDLDERGLLDETLVLVLSEHGRTPRINNAAGGGRDHWSQAYTILMGGGGVARGRVVGRTDRHGGTVTERPVSPKDILATTYHLLGIDPETLLHDRTGRPLPLAPGGQVVDDVLA